MALPQLLCFTFRQAAGEGFIRLTWNWINEQDPYLWFYIKNWGLVFLLLPFALLNARGKPGAISLFPSPLDPGRMPGVSTQRL